MHNRNMEPIQKKSKVLNQFIPNGTIDPCVHCGFCLPTCASYRVLGTEMDSPRGRIHILKSIESGELKMDKTIAHHFNTCLGCFACVTACPSGVRYDKLIEATRPEINTNNLESSCQKLFKKILLSILPYPKRLRTILHSVRGYSGSHFQNIFRELKFTRIFGSQIEEMEALLPPLVEGSFKDNFKIINEYDGAKRGRIGLVLGCVQRCFDPDVNQATLAVLQANGFEVIIPNDQGCCGAVTHHQGYINSTIRHAEELVKSFVNVIGKGKPAGEEPLDAIVVAASGCGHTMKAYQTLLDKEKNFQIPVLDVHEFLVQNGLSKKFIESLQPIKMISNENITSTESIEVAYHDACHMIHGQKISEEPRQLLKKIPNIVLREVKEMGLCCGSAGIYNLIQPEIAKELGTIKVNDLSSTGASIVASANIGCTLQIRRHRKSDLKVLHPMQLLAKSAGIDKSPNS